MEHRFEMASLRKRGREPTRTRRLSPIPRRRLDLLFESLENRQLFSGILGTADTFAALAGSAVTNTGPTVLNGDLGVSPGSAITGFPPGLITAPGQIHQTDAVAQQAEADATTAYNSLAGLPTSQNLSGQDLGGLTLTPGVYTFSSSAQLTGTLTLDAQNDPNAKFVFQIGSSLTTASASKVVVINDPPCIDNIFWQVGSSATLGTTTDFNGTIVALTSITMNTGATITQGGALAINGAVTLDSNTISPDQCGSISGSEFTDTNGNGAHDSGEPGLPGVTVFLDANGNGSPDGGEATTVSGADGSYVFDDVPPGPHTVVEVVPPGSVQTTPPPGVTIVPPRGDAPGGDIGNFVLGQIGGTKFSDINGNGTRDSGDNGIAGVTIFIDANANGTLDAGEVRTTTAADGSYSLTGVGPGSSIIREVTPAGTTQTTANPAAITMTSGGAVTGINFGNRSSTEQIIGTKFVDTNGNGTRDAGEPGLAGVTIFIDANNNGVLNTGEISTVTTAGGSYVFANIAAGTYNIREVVSSGWIQTTTNPSPLVITTVSAGATVTGGNFGNFQLGSISGTKFLDECGNGTSPNGKTISGVTIKLYRDLNANGIVDASDGAAVQSTVTASNGTYSFTGLTARDYVVSEVVPAGYINTSAISLGAKIVSGSVFTAKNFLNFKLEDCSLNNISYSIKHAGVTTVYSTLADHVRAGDIVTASFTIPAGDSEKISFVSYSAPTGVKTVATLADQTVFDSQTQTFAPGRHSLTVTVPNTFFQVDLVCGCVITKFGAPGSNIFYTEQGRQHGGYFGLPDASISGTAFNDLNGNGNLDSGEPKLAGWKMYLDKNSNNAFDSGEPSVLSDANGVYKFNGVIAGNYRVGEVTNSGWTRIAPSTTYGVNLRGVDVTGKNFANARPGSISGTVFNDRNGNGVKNTGEAGLSGWTVFNDANGNGKLDSGELNVKTNASGTYKFSGLKPGTFSVRKVLNAGYKATTPVSLNLALTSGVDLTGGLFGVQLLA